MAFGRTTIFRLDSDEILISCFKVQLRCQRQFASVGVDLERIALLARCDDLHDRISYLSVDTVVPIFSRRGINVKTN